MRINLTHLRGIGFVLWGHCQNILDDPRISAKHDNGVDCYDCEIQTLVNVLCSHRGDISLGISLCYDIALKKLEFLECNGIFVLK